MNRRDFMSATAALGLTGAGVTNASAAGLTEFDASAGIRAALERGADSAVSLLGRTDGFLGNPKVRIPLPGYLEDASKLLKNFGQGKRIDELVTAINRAGGSTDGAALAAQMVKFKKVPTISGLVSFSPALHTVFGRQYRVIKISGTKASVVGSVTAKVVPKI